MYAELNDTDAYFVSEGTYAARRTLLMRTEAFVLRVLSFQTHVALPHALSINYLQTLDAFSNPQASAVAKRAFAHLNTVLLSPQLVYLTHQPNAIATSAIYLAAREMELKLPGDEWWEVFDTDREELGFLVVAMLSMHGFAAQEKAKWESRKVPLTVEEVEAELERRKLLEDGE
jgi:cyclin L